ncbi:hypothetical protein [Streptomyces sp. NPDC058295]|uniref:hypothetical protein n=1 Tax=Streptomyces sp. NPDC058295 TaxID=3346431 RepID=UPI0036EFCD27
MGQEIGFNADSVNRSDAATASTGPRGITDRIDTAVRPRWQRRKEAATATGITIETRAQFGYSAPASTGRRTFPPPHRLRAWAAALSVRLR